MAKDFDPDKFLAETAPASSNGDFNPDQFLAETAPKPQSKPVEAFVQGVGEAATMGYLPQLQAAVAPVFQKTMEAAFGDPNAELKKQGFKFNEPSLSEQYTPEAYLQRRDQAIQESQQLKESNPYASIAGNIVGGLGGGLGTAKLLGQAATAATTAGRVGQALKAGAAIGAIRNPGDTQGEISPLQLEDRAKNATSDALTGAIVQGGAETIGKVGKILKEAPDTLKEYSQIKAFKASGAMLKDFRKAYGKGKVEELGQAMIDQGIVGMGDDIANIAEKSKLALESSGKKIGDIYKEADSSLKGVVTPHDIKNLIDDYSNEAANRLGGQVGGKNVANKIQDEVLSIIEDNKNPTYGDLRKLRASIDDHINYAKQTQDLPEYQSELLNIRNKIQDLIKNKLGTVDKSLQEKFIRENKTYSNLSEIEKIARDKISREESNAAFGLRERIQGGLGGVVGGSIGGIPGAIAGAAIGSVSTKVARQYGTPFVAITTNKIANALQQNPGALGKFSDTLIKAASVSPKELTTTVNLLLKKPEFKKQLKGL